MQGPFYVYELTDPRDGAVFYVGKGKGRRMYCHVIATRNGVEKNPYKARRINEILFAGMQVIERKIVEGLAEREAIRIERETIARYGLENLTNISLGDWTPLERSKARAANDLARVKPFEVWVSERFRLPSEVALYHRIVAELKKIAEFGYPAEIVVTPHGIELR